MVAHRPKGAPTPDQAHRLAALGRVPREVFDLLAASTVPLKAYELLWLMQKARGRPSPPTTIYRGLNVLMEAGLAHKVESLGAYVICRGPAHAHTPTFFICEVCKTTLELELARTPAEVKERIVQSRFTLHHLNYDIRGICGQCAAARSAGGDS